MKYQFSLAERFAILEAFGGQCYWCGEPLPIRDTTVDHVLPESLLDKPEEFNRIRTHYGLPSHFSLNDFCNWVPAHGKCNSKKKDAVFALSPALLAVLLDVERRSEKARSTAEKIKSDNKKGRILAKIEAAIEGGVLSKEEILDLFSGIEPPAKQTTISVSERWSIVRDENGFAFVTDGRVFGITPSMPNPDSSWRCPSCGGFGPWNGVICLNCGQMSDPND